MQKVRFHHFRLKLLLDLTDSGSISPLFSRISSLVILYYSLKLLLNNTPILGVRPKGAPVVTLCPPPAPNGGRAGGARRRPATVAYPPSPYTTAAGSRRFRV